MAAKGKTSTLDVGRFPTQRAPWRPAEKTCIQGQTAAPVKTRVRGCVSFSPSRTGGLETSNQFPHRGLQASDAETRVGLFSWDEENRLVNAKRTSDSVVLGTYKYDALGRRVQKTSSEGTRTYVLSGAQIVQEYLGTVLERSYVYGTYVDEVLVQVKGGEKAYFHTNHLYSTAALTNSAGAVVERYGYDAYGKRVTLDANGALRTTPAVTTVGFTGRTLDAETGLWYFRARYFSEGLNRFIGRDPLTFNTEGNIWIPEQGMGYYDGLSLYFAYFAQNDLDPTGFIKCIGKARVITTGGKTVGKPGAYGDPVSSTGAAVARSQWKMDKGEMRKHRKNISGRFYEGGGKTGDVGTGKNGNSSDLKDIGGFDQIDEEIGPKKNREKTIKDNPGEIIIERNDGKDLGHDVIVIINLPDACKCPDNTTELK